MRLRRKTKHYVLSLIIHGHGVANPYSFEFLLLQAVYLLGQYITVTFVATRNIKTKQLLSLMDSLV